MIVVALMIIVLVTSIAIPQADAKKHNSKLLREFEKKIQEATADNNTVNKNHNKTGGALKKFEQKLAEGVGNTTQQTKTESYRLVSFGRTSEMQVFQATPLC